MTRQKTPIQPTAMPTGQTASGPGNASLPNPKDRVVGYTTTYVTPDGDNGLAQDGKFGTSTYFPSEVSLNTAAKGGPGDEPDPATINRGYSQVTTDNVPAVSKVVSANRLRAISPGDQQLGGNGPSADPVPGKYPTFGGGQAND
jgi:hypothetical protein